VIEKDKLISQLTVDGVLEILNLLEKSDFDFLHLEAGDLKLTVGKKGYHSGDDESPRTASTHPTASSQPDLKLETSAAETSRGQTNTARPKRRSLNRAPFPSSHPW
jgi:hypothetical protein